MTLSQLYTAYRELQRKVSALEAELTHCQSDIAQDQHRLFHTECVLSSLIAERDHLREENERFRVELIETQALRLRDAINFETMLGPRISP